MKDILKNAKGTEILDSRGQPIAAGDNVMVNGIAGTGRARVKPYFAVVVGFSYKTFVYKGDSLASQDKLLKMRDDAVAQNKRFDPTCDELKAVGTSWFDVERVSPENLTVVSERFIKGWNDGTIFQ